MKKTNQNDKISDWLEDDCPLCQLMSDQKPGRRREMEMGGEFYVNVSLLEEAKQEMMEAMRKAGIRPEIIYAFDKTGLLPTEEHIELFSDDDLTEWQNAIEAYRRTQGD